MVSGILAGAAGGATINIIIKAVDSYSKQFNKLDTSIKKQQTGFQKLTGSLKNLGFGYAVLAGAAVGFGADAVKVAIDSERAFQQFNLRLGETADIMLNDLRKASNGMASDLALVNAANRALALGIAENKLPELMAAASARAKVFGRTVPEAFDDITIGIGRQSRMILDNLGIIIDLDAAHQEYAASIGKTSETLTELEKKEALTNAILKESETLMIAQNFLIETHDEKLQRLTATWDNMKGKSGTGLLQFFDLLSVQMSLMTLNFDEAKTKVLEFGKQFTPLAKEFSVLRDEILAGQQALNDYENQLLGLTQIQLSGESAKTAQIVGKEAELAELELAILKGTAAQGDAIKIEQLKIELEILRKEREVEFTNVKKVEKAKADAFLAEKTGIEVNRDAFMNAIESKKASWDIEIDKINEARAAMDELVRSQTEYSSGSIGSDDSGGGSFFGNLFSKKSKTTRVADAIIRPNGDVVETDPNDTIFATKNPGGMGGIVVNINSITGLDAESISRALSDELSSKVSL